MHDVIVIDLGSSRDGPVRFVLGFWGVVCCFYLGVIFIYVIEECSIVLENLARCFILYRLNI